jgi:hypothetical protein
MIGFPGDAAYSITGLTNFYACDKNFDGNDTSFPGGVAPKNPLNVLGFERL